jgi:hypothetical protein
VVVVVPESVELVLELVDGVGRILAFQEQFQGLPKPLNFALRGRFIGSTVVLNDALKREKGFEGVAAAEAECCGRKSGGQSGDRFAVFGGAVGESVDNGGTSDARIATCCWVDLR